MEGLWGWAQLAKEKKISVLSSGENLSFSASVQISNLKELIYFRTVLTPRMPPHRKTFVKIADSVQVPFSQVHFNY